MALIERPTPELSSSRLQSAFRLATVTNSGQTLVTPLQTLAGLNVSRQVTVPNTGSQDFARTDDYFQNPISNAITTTVQSSATSAPTPPRGFATSSATHAQPERRVVGTDGGPGTTAVISISTARPG